MCVQIVLDADLLHSVWRPWNHCMHFHLSKGLISLPSHLAEIGVLSLNFKSQLTTSLEIPIVAPCLSWYSGLLQIQPFSHPVGVCFSELCPQCPTVNSEEWSWVSAIPGHALCMPCWLAFLLQILLGMLESSSVWSYFKSRVKFH